MTYLLSIDPGQNTGIALGYYDATSGYRLIERWQVHGGLPGFMRWWHKIRPDHGYYDELVIEQFVLSGANEFTADLTPVGIEGALYVLLEGQEIQPTWQLRTAKGELVGYPATAKTPAQRQRVRFDFLDRFGLYAEGEDNIDSNDAITHALVYLKARKHMPTMRKYWREN